jgi:hypothetical protein
MVARWRFIFLKAQGLTLDKVQIAIDGCNWNSLLYVAVSRARHGSDVLLTGGCSIEEVCSTKPEVKEWI